MTSKNPEVLPPPAALCTLWRLYDPRFISHRANTHWHVSTNRGPAILRHYGDAVSEQDIAYELQIGDQLAAAGWPIAPLLESPFRYDDRWWALFGMLSGEQRDGPGEDRRRGRLLAAFHATTNTFPATQRPGFPPVRDVLFDPRLGGALRFVERHFPEHGRILLWHRELARTRFDEATGSSSTTVIHGDFTSRNLLYVGDRLTGILDFEGTHIDNHIADFALSWRGRRDDVVLGYDEVTPLSELDWHLLTPCMWAWAFLGVAADVERMQRGIITPHGFDWQVAMLLRRSPLMGPDAAEYRDQAS